MKLLETSELGYVVRSGHQILDGINLEMSFGESAVIVGPNGAGKSTLLRSILGLLGKKGTRGNVSIGGVCISELSRSRQSRLVSYVPQRPVFPPRMKLVNYVLLGRTPYISAFGSESKADLEAVTRALVRTNLEWAADRRLFSLSGGETQLAAVARALATEAPLMLLDEPTASLDFGNRLSLMEFIYNGLQKDENGDGEKTTVLSTMHDLMLAGRFGDKLLLMADGKIQAEGSAQQVLTSENIMKYYGIWTKIMKDEKGGIYVLPRHSAN